MTDEQLVNLEKRIRGLLRNPAFRRLRTRGERFRPLEAFGIAHREHSHSNFLAFLLNPNARHGLQDRFLRDFIALAADSAPLTEGKESPLPLTAELAIDPDKVQVYRERHNIDVLINCLQDGPVIGIEVKLWADEQHEQVKRYQNRLETTYAGRQGLIVFLSPDGLPPETGCEGHSVPCVSISWAAVAELIDGLLRPGEDNTATLFIEEFSRHLKELTMANQDDRALAAALFKNPEMVRVFRDIGKLRPRFWDKEILDTLKKKGAQAIRQITASEVTVDVRDTKGDATVTFIVDDWRSKGFPIRFTFYHEPGWHCGSFPGLHAVLSEFDSLGDDEKKKYRGIASQCESLAAEPNKAGGWYKKHSAVQNPPDGPDLGWVIEDESFDADWMDKAAKMLSELVGQIHQELKIAKVVG